MTGFHLQLDAPDGQFIFERMKMISIWIGLLTLMAVATPRASAQDAATQQQLDKLSGQIQDLTDAQSAEGKRIDALEKKIADMEEKVNTPSGGDYASTDDLKKLAGQVQEIDKKREEDNKKILDAIREMAKGGTPHIKPSNSDDSGPASTGDTGPASPNPTPTQGQNSNQQGYPYKIESGNTLSAIAKAYQAKGVKVTVKQILAANPGLNPNSLIVGHTIFIPAPQ